MPYTIKSCKNGIYWISYSGTVDLALRLQALQTVEEASRHIPIRGNLIDFRDTELLCSFTEQFEFATKAAGQYGHRGRKAAYLVKDLKAAPIEILELAMSNRGIETRLFTDELKAVNWLTGGCYKSCEDFKKSCCAVGNMAQCVPEDSVSSQNIGK
jgi:hypothetical protein